MGFGGPHRLALAPIFNPNKNQRVAQMKVDFRGPRQLAFAQIFDPDEYR